MAVDVFNFGSEVIFKTEPNEDFESEHIRNVLLTIEVKNESRLRTT